MLRGTRTRAGLEVFKGCLEVRLELGLVSDFFECYGTQTRAGLGVFEGCGTRKRAGFGFFRMLWDSNPCWFGYFFCQIILKQQSKKIRLKGLRRPSKKIRLKGHRLQARKSDLYISLNTSQRVQSMRVESSRRHSELTVLTTKTQDGGKREERRISCILYLYISLCL